MWASCVVCVCVAVVAVVMVGARTQVVKGWLEEQQLEKLGWRAHVCVCVRGGRALGTAYPMQDHSFV